MASADPFQVGPGSSESSDQEHMGVHGDTLEIHIKTLDSQMYTFRVENDMRIAVLKEKIATSTGLPTGQQRLIFRGRVLKDDHTLSEYHIEDGHTLHLVARQPVQPQSQSASSSDNVSSQNGNNVAGTDAGQATQRTRIGHSVVVGLNVTDQGEGTVADISRIVGAVLNSFGIGIANNTMVAGNLPASAIAVTSLASQGVESETGRQNGSGGVQSGNQPPNPSTGTILRQMVIPDSLATLNGYITRMEQTLSIHTDNDASPQVSIQENTINSAGYPNIGTLVAVIDRAQRLLSGPVTATLHHLSGRLEQERSSSELAVRDQVQAEVMYVGVAMQHLGSLFLELGRTLSTLRMGEPPAEPMVMSGPAVYINASGPNPLMVQPNAHHPVPIFGIPSLTPLVNLGVPEQVMLGDTGRNIDIHVHAANSTAAGMPIAPAMNVGDVAHGQSLNPGLPIRPGTGLAGSHTVVGNMPQTANANVDGLRLSGSNLQFLGNRSQRSHGSDASQLNPGVGAASTAGAESTSCATTSSIVAQVPSANALQPAVHNQPSKDVTIGNAGDMGTSTMQASSVSSSTVCEQKIYNGVNGDNSTVARVPTFTSDGDDGHRKPSKSAVDDSIHASGSSTARKSNEPTPLGLGLASLQPRKQAKRTVSRGNNAMHNGASGVVNEHLIAKGQEVLESLVSQGSRQKQASSSVAQGSSQQVGDRTNLGGMFSGMLHQMMPAVSQMLGVGQSTPMSSTRALGSQRNNRVGISNASTSQVALQDAIERITQRDSSVNIFRAMLEATRRLQGEQISDGFLEGLGNNEELASEFVEMLHRHLHHRLQSGSGGGSGPLS